MPTKIAQLKNEFDKLFEELSELNKTTGKLCTELSLEHHCYSKDSSAAELTFSKFKQFENQRILLAKRNATFAPRVARLTLVEKSEKEKLSKLFESINKALQAENFWPPNISKDFTKLKSTYEPTKSWCIIS